MEVYSNAKTMDEVLDLVGKDLIEIADRTGISMYVLPLKPQDKEEPLNLH